jgi:hypothetical protein
VAESATAPAIETLRSAGLTVTFKPTRVAFGKDCQLGTIGELEAVVCAYASPDEAKAAETSGLAWVGAATGAAWSSRELMVAVVDRKNRDPNGKAIDRVMKLIK